MRTLASVCAGCSQPLGSAAHSMPSRSIRANNSRPDAPTNRDNRSPASAPIRLDTSRGPMPPMKLGTTKPVLRPDAPKPNSSASSRIVDTPRSARCSAIDRPRMPPPTIATSACCSPCSGAVGSGGADRADHSEARKVSSPGGCVDGDAVMVSVGRCGLCGCGKGAEKGAGGAKMRRRLRRHLVNIFHDILVRHQFPFHASPATAAVSWAKEGRHLWRCPESS